MAIMLLPSSSLWAIVDIMGVSYSKEVLLVGRYAASIIFPVGIVIMGVSYSKEVLLVVSM